MKMVTFCRFALLFLVAPMMAVGAEPVYLTVKAVKSEPTRCVALSTLNVLSHADRWHERKGDTWDGENDWEVFFTLTADKTNSPPRLAMTCPGVKVSRVIVGRTDVKFTASGDRVEFDAVADRSNGMLINNSLPDPIGSGLPVGLYHNWRMRANPDAQGRVRGCGPYNGRPYPDLEARAVSNYLLAAREALRHMGGMGPRDTRLFDGNIVLLSFEVACGRAHNDFPPHVHIMLYVPGYTPGSQVTHFYMDERGRIVSNSFTELGVKDSRRAGNYGPGDVCRMFDLKGNLGLECVITPEGGILLRKKLGADEYLLIGDEQAGAAEKVCVIQRGRKLATCSSSDDAERGVITATVELTEECKPARTITQTLRYDPFTGRVLEQAKP
ncbi:MAG: hypothetical protein A2107_11675 [Verrucomicrobia bacterium GWF2_62_7]|nr:MAG: hypothetical protein A2107_11675 [Verrucomicrobia bacterium GWF2_62_7]